MELSNNTSVEAKCHCGQVKIIAPYSPLKVTSCNCSICHAYGHICAYYSDKEVIITGETHTYSHGDRGIAFHRCINCGCHVSYI